MFKRGKDTSNTISSQSTSLEDSGSGINIVIRQWLKKAVTLIPFVPSGLANPGRFDQLTSDVADIIPDPFDGLKLEVSRPINSSVATSHSISAGSMVSPSGYWLGGSVDKGKLLLAGRMNRHGAGSFRGRLELNKSLAARINAQIIPGSLLHNITPIVENDSGSGVGIGGENEGAARTNNESVFGSGPAIEVDGEIEAGRDDWSSQVKLAPWSNMYGIQYLQSLSPSIALGGEAFVRAMLTDSESSILSSLQLGPIIGKKISIPLSLSALIGRDKEDKGKHIQAGLAGVTVGGRHSNPLFGHSSLFSISSIGHISAAYVHKINDKVRIGAQFEHSVQSGESVAAIGYNFNLTQATVRGQIDTRGHMATVIEEKLVPGVSMLLSGDLDHVSKKYAFGIGLQIG